MKNAEDKKFLIIYRLNQARETIREVDTLIKVGLLIIAVNRIYYGMFYCLSALAYKYEFQSSKHLQLIGWFNQQFVKTGVIDKKYGKILRNAYKNRSDGDYLPFISFKEDDVLSMKLNLEDFIDKVESLIRNTNDSEILFP